MARRVTEEEHEDEDECILSIVCGVIIGLLLVAGAIWGLVVYFRTPKVDPQLLETLSRRNSSTDIAVNFGWNGSGSTFGGKRDEGVVARLGSRLVLAQPALMLRAQNSQYRVQGFLASKGVPFESLWISNQLLVPGADLKLVQELADFPEVEEIYDGRTGTLYSYNLEFNITSKAVHWFRKSISFKFYKKGDAVLDPKEVFGTKYGQRRLW